MRGQQTGFQPLAASLGSTADLKDAFTPNRDLFEEASRSLWVRMSIEAPGMVDDIVLRAQEQVEKGLRLCDSPIEKRVLPFLVCQNYGNVGNAFAVVHSIKDEPALPIAPICVVPQAPLFKYRVNFLLVATSSIAGTSMVAVECDGADFHQNDSADHARDRYLRSWGIPTVRATGKEIYKSPASFAMRAGGELLTLMERAGLKV